MRRWWDPALMLVAIATLSVATPAFAGPFKETLPRSERIAIAEAIQRALPKVDQGALERCKAKYDLKKIDPMNDPDTVAEAAACFRGAGSLGVAIQLWEQVRIKAGVSKVKPEMVRDLAIAREAAGMFEEAAMAYEDYLSVYYVHHQLTPDGQTPKDAVEILTRATCIYRQLGDEEGARRAIGTLQSRSKTKIAPDTLCDHLRPVAMPAQTHATK